MTVYDIFDNELSGEISPILCNVSSLQLLDLSHNRFTGVLPNCLEKLSSSLLVLGMRNNYFHGTIPQLCANGSKLEMIDLGQNQFGGQLPRSLKNCLMLESLNLGENQLKDVFPSWLGSLPKLRLLTLRSNYLYGRISWSDPLPNLEVSNLHLIDLSSNSFTGKLTCDYFQKLKAMKEFDATNTSYMKANPSFDVTRAPWSLEYMFSTTVTNKGMDLFYKKIQKVLVVIDFSGNKLEGEIPECIGILQGLRVLNLSNNILTGHIPSSLGNMRQLESLDISRNKLSGQIPPQLVQLTFLAFFNVSQNHLTGRIPRGNQLNTFESNSFEGNSGLCGDPLSRRCENFVISLPPLSEEQDSGKLIEFDWRTIVPGFVCGLVVGLIIEHTFASKKQRKTRWLAF